MEAACLPCGWGAEKSPGARTQRLAVNARTAARPNRLPSQPFPGWCSQALWMGTCEPTAATTGQVIWDMDTVRDYETVNGQKARGGSLDVAGPVIADGTLYVNSGYGQWGGMPGNVLLAFSVDGR